MRSLSTGTAVTSSRKRCRQPSVQAATANYASSPPSWILQLDRHAENLAVWTIGPQTGTGLYKRARAGQIKNFTGIDSPDEPPEAPDIHLDTDSVAIERSAEPIIDFLKKVATSKRADEAQCGRGEPAPVLALRSDEPSRSRTHARTSVAAYAASSFMPPISGLTQPEAAQVANPWPG
jgi:hypothetical protein